MTALTRRRPEPGWECHRVYMQFSVEVGGQHAAGGQLGGDGSGGGRGQALGLVQSGQLEQFGLRGSGEFAFLLAQRNDRRTPRCA